MSKKDKKSEELPAIAEAGPVKTGLEPEPRPEVEFKEGVVELSRMVFPSEEHTISVENDRDYGGAHTYTVRNSLGFADGKPVYEESTQTIQFVHKAADGTITSGLQSEQLAIILLDRASKLNRKFPSEQYYKMVQGLNLFLDACQERVQERINRGVMGDLKK